MRHDNVFNGFPWRFWNVTMLSATDPRRSAASSLPCRALAPPSLRRTVASLNAIRSRITIFRNPLPVHNSMMATERPRCGAHPAAAYLCFMTAPTSPCIITSTLSRPLMGWRGGSCALDRKTAAPDYFKRYAERFHAFWPVGLHAAVPWAD